MRAVARSQPIDIIKPRIEDGGAVEDLRKLAESGSRAGTNPVRSAMEFCDMDARWLGGRQLADRSQAAQPRPPYPTMSLEEIYALPVENLAARDCALFMWVVRSHLPQALEITLALGF